MDKMLNTDELGLPRENVEPGVKPAKGRLSKMLLFLGICALLLVVGGVMFLMDQAKLRSEKTKMEKFSALPHNTTLVCSSAYILPPGILARDIKNGEVVRKWRLVRAKVDKDWRWFVLDTEKGKLWSVSDCQVLQEVRDGK